VNAVVREAARALVLDPDDRVLLVRLVNPTRLARFLRQLLETGPPDEPFDVGV
jgi:hypothetical protein